MTGLLNSNMKFYRKLVDNDKLKSKLKDCVFDLMYHEFNKNKKSIDNHISKNKSVMYSIENKPMMGSC